MTVRTETRVSTRLDPSWGLLPTTPAALVARVYAEMRARIEADRARLVRPRTLTEKLIIGHLASQGELPQRGTGYVECWPDRLAMPDCGAQMALLRLMTIGDWRVSVPTTVHCDTMIVARESAAPDLQAAHVQHREVYDFLRTASARFGLGFWEPGSGIHHQVLLENYAFPGGFLVANNSHTPNAGGVGMLAIGVGGADVVDGMTDRPILFRMPRIIGVRLVGQLRGWATPKDVILHLAGHLTVKGGTGAVIEYFGPGAATLSATGKATVCNMGAELGATTSVFPFDATITDFLASLGRGDTADLAQVNQDVLVADPEVALHPEQYYDQVLEIDLSRLEPLVAGPSSPDLVRPVRELAEVALQGGYPLNWSQALIGSCTNSSYEDIGRAANVARQFAAAGMHATVPLAVTPGSDSILKAVSRDGFLSDLVGIGAQVFANACGPCFGQWDRRGAETGEMNAIITSYNRNFPGRNDGSRATLAFIASPEVVVAAAVAGRLDVDPTRIELSPGRYLLAPAAEALPADGWAACADGFRAPVSTGTRPEIRLLADSERLASLEPFPEESAERYGGMRLLMKVAGSCTTDDISPAGKWLRFRGHLDRMADNTMSGATDAFTGEVGRTFDLLRGQVRGVAEVARGYRDAGAPWVIVGDENLGEGSSREHAAMQIRHLGGLVVVARGFARIFEENLKKNGVLPLTFLRAEDYASVRRDDRFSIAAIRDLCAGEPVKIRIEHADGSSSDAITNHSLTPEQVGWIHAGSDLNVLPRR